MARINIRPSALLIAAALVLFPAAARALDKVTLQANWRAQAEQGGFYQAIATGIYAKHGLEVDLLTGGPQLDPSTMLLTGKADFVILHAYSGLNYVRENLPFVVAAAFFQKDPTVLIAHPGMGNDTLGALKGKPIMIGANGRTSYWPFLRAKFGYTDDQIRTYTFNLGPFLADKNAIQQGYLTSEVFMARSAGVDPVIHLLADSGFDNYQATINTSRKMVEQRPDVAQRFINGSIEGWYSYLYGDPAPANALIKRDNTQMPDEVIAYAIKAMKDYGVVDSGDTKTLGIGAMTDVRWARFFKAAAETYPADLDVKKAYTLQFVNQKVGM